MTRQELIEAVAKKGFDREKVQVAVDTLFESLSSAMRAGVRVEIRGFGSFETNNRVGYTMQSPHTGELVVVPKRRTANFRLGKELRERINAEDDEKSPSGGPLKGTPEGDLE